MILTVKAKRIPNWILQDETAAELQQSPVYVETPEEEIELIPLGCARLRISCFPIITNDQTADTWEKIPSHIPLNERPQPFEKRCYDFQTKSTVSGEHANAPWEP